MGELSIKLCESQVFSEKKHNIKDRRDIENVHKEKTCQMRI